jgi:hypothetical protein
MTKTNDADAPKEYAYRGDTSLIFHDLSHGHNAIVFRDGEPVVRPHIDDEPDDALLGSTVILEPGDTVLIAPDALNEDGEFVHHLLEPLEKDENHGHTEPTIDELKAQLDELGVDRKGVRKKEDLAALLDGALQVALANASEQHNPANEPPPGSVATPASTDDNNDEEQN